MIASFVILEYHSIDDVTTCISAIRRLDLRFEYEIIVSSNSTYDREQQRKLLEMDWGVQWTFNRCNNGFAYGMNCGIRKAKGKFLILQNPDTQIIKGDLGEVFSMIERGRVGVVGPKIVNSKNEIQDSCRSFMTPTILLQRFYFRYVKRLQNITKKNFDYSKMQTVDWVIGGFMIVPRTTIEAVGLLCEDYFLYIEDMDYCFNVWGKGLEVYYYPELCVQYEGDRKSSKVNVYSVYHLANYLRFLKKNLLRLFLWNRPRRGA
ncbi:glycosyltransferase family 2 protein [bacterium]|nr:glycosyltransferase family 2 protein [bacterium]